MPKSIYNFALQDIFCKFNLSNHFELNGEILPLKSGNVCSQLNAEIA